APELDREEAVAAVVGTRELEGPLRLGVLAGAALDRGPAEEREQLALLVGARGVPGPPEERPRLDVVADALARELALPDDRAAAGRVRRDVGHRAGYLDGGLAGVARGEGDAGR